VQIFTATGGTGVAVGVKTGRIGAGVSVVIKTRAGAVVGVGEDAPGSAQLVRRRSANRIIICFFIMVYTSTHLILIAFPQPQ